MRFVSWSAAAVAAVGVLVLVAVEWMRPDGAAQTGLRIRVLGIGLCATGLLGMLVRFAVLGRG